MAIIQLAGYSAFILASLMLGTRLIRLYRRTREWPELTIGASFLLSGCLGYMAWLAVGVLIAGEGRPETVNRVAIVGLAFTVIGALCNGIGSVMIFRPQGKWARIWVASVGVGMFACWSYYATCPVLESSGAFWWTVLMAAPLYVWGAVEAFLLGRVFRKRARHIYGLAPPAWTATLASCALLVGAAAIWLGFLPPAFHRDRIQRTLGAE